MTVMVTNCGYTIPSVSLYVFQFSFELKCKDQGLGCPSKLKLVTLILDAWHTPCPSIGLWYLSVCLRRYFYYSKYLLKYHLRFVYNV